MTHFEVDARERLNARERLAHAARLQHAVARAARVARLGLEADARPPKGRGAFGAACRGFAAA